VVSTSSQGLGRLHSSYDPAYVPDGLSTHFTAHHPSVSSNYQPDFAFNGYFKEPSEGDQIFKEYLRILEGTSEVPRDSQKNNPNAVSTSQSADHQETQTAQDVGAWHIHDLSGISDHTPFTMTKVPPIFNSPSSFPRDLQMSAISSGGNLSQNRNLESLTNLREIRSKKTKATSPFLINVEKVNQDPHFLQEQTASPLPRYKRKRISCNEILFQRFLRNFHHHSVCIHGQQPQHGLPCIEEEGSLMFHSGAFSIDNPSSIDTFKIRALKSMIDDPDTTSKPLLILENHLKEYVKYYHGRHSSKRGKKEGTIGGEEHRAIEAESRHRIRDDNREKAVTIIHSKIDDWMKFYEAKCGIEFKDLDLSNGQFLGNDAMRTCFVLFLQRVDTISTIVVKKEPLISKGNLRDVLKYAAENFQSIYQHSWNIINQKKRNHSFDQIIFDRQSKVRASKKVNIFIETWLKLGKNEDSNIPNIPWENKVVIKYLSSLFEDVWFYTTKSLDQYISHVDLDKISRSMNHLSTF
jgi:hypothetical protein